MHNHRTRGKILKILSLQYQLSLENSDVIIGVDKELLISKMKCEKLKLSLFLKYLQNEEEVIIYKFGKIDGYCVTNKGYNSFQNKKYYVESEKIFFDKVKNWVQTIIPILSLFITIAVIYNNNSTSKKNLEKIEKKVDSLQNLFQVKNKIKK